MTFTVDVKKFKIPKSVAADINNSKSKTVDKTKDDKKGKIYLTLSNYQINKGIADAIFKK
jgi:outer membrane lipoprotein-sorting protein